MEPQSTHIAARHAWAFITWRWSATVFYGVIFFLFFGVAPLLFAVYSLATHSYDAAMFQGGLGLAVAVLFFWPLIWRTVARRLLGRLVADPWKVRSIELRPPGVSGDLLF